MNAKLEQELENAIIDLVERMDIKELQQYAIDDLWRFYCNASDDVINEFLGGHNEQSQG